MNMKAIQEKQARENVAYDVALKIRALLDEARKAYGPQGWENDDVENQVSELVFGEE
jgi:hypothetical protein